MELTMAEKLDPRQIVTFEELLRAMMMEQDATRRVLVRKGLLTNEEVLEEIKVVRREMEGKRARSGEQLTPWHNRCTTFSGVVRPERAVCFASRTRIAPLGD